VTARLATEVRLPCDLVVVDEAQDVSVAQLRLVAALGACRPDALFFAGNLGRRIFQLPFSWRALGVDVRGRSVTLRINYRTSHQIRTQADRLRGRQVSDVDGNTEERGGTISVFNGPTPRLHVVPTAAEEGTTVARWLGERTRDGLAPEEICVFVRSPAEMPRGRAAVVAAGLSVACDDEVLPLQSRIEAVADEGDLHRARDHLLVTGVNPASEFLDDLRARPQ
jgi:superfamily I DNA/RNA helicase